MFKTKKSAGVSVTPAVHRLIQQANAARASGGWSVAAEYFAAAVARDPSLYHVWMQLGHAHKESKSYQKAEQAYLKATELRPTAGEPYLHLGHLYKVTGDYVKAGRAYMHAVKVDPANADAVAELHRQLGASSGMTRDRMLQFLEQEFGEDVVDTDEGLGRSVRQAKESLSKILAHLPGKAEEARLLRSASMMLENIDRMAPADENEGEVALIFDASDLIGYYSHARLPTGIQRVQIEAITNALNAPNRQVKICCFIDGREDWLEVPISQFRAITELSVRSGARDDPEWVSALNRLHLTLVLADPLEFPDGAYLINLGTSWWLHNYFLFVRAAQEKHRIKYIPFIHDFIPIVTPQHCVKGLTQDFISWAIGVFEHAACYLVNSQATKRDLLKVAAILGHDVDPDDIAVIRLDADFRKPETRQLARGELAKWGLDNEPYVLFVSTIESRKGHVVAMDAWLELIQRHGGRKTPRLVCVGKNGWLNDAVFQRLEQSDELASRVTILSYLSDEELSLLYRNCQFTIYPSLYEGWGLPITESLCYGKPVIAARSSSLPEAGGEFAVYAEAGSPVQLANAVENMVFDPVYRAERQLKIATDFQPRTWSDVAQQIDDEIMSLVHSRPALADHAIPKAKIGAYHPVTRNVATRIWPGIGSGEIFRTGLGWLWPDTWGCWTRPEGGELTIGLPSDRKPLRVYLLLQNFPNHTCPWRLRIKGLPSIDGELQMGEHRWVSFDYPVLDDGGTLRMKLRGGWSEIIKMSTGGTIKEYSASVGLKGFFLCEADDHVARTKFLEAASLGTISDLDAFREHLEPTQDEDDWNN
ncbi:glycosyltransferase [Sphingomonas sp. AP4-R1]|uniref:glycosyltransferase n=1 Tax=Sphingomonas sp. AP4-R1 TaxID=2735134 RepID=UPI0014934591|nr:glycosyltransferase [Sphingomonas sp. AP4-R1]QJU57625.1 glycosyltransferase [Sphingomonas sp. AP4-R1]